MKKTFAKVEVDLFDYSKLVTKSQQYDELLETINQVIDIQNIDGVTVADSNFEALVMSVLPSIIDIKDIRQLEIRNSRL